MMKRATKNTRENGELGTYMQPLSLGLKNPYEIGKTEQSLKLRLLANGDGNKERQ